MDINKWNSQLRKGVLEFCILALLEKEKNYGYKLILSLSDFTGMDIKRGTIYALFKRLYEEGLIDYVLEESSSGPPRKIYSLTNEGRTALEEMRTHWGEFISSINEVLGGGFNE